MPKVLDYDFNSLDPTIFYNLMLDAIEIGYRVIDQNGQIRLINDRYLEMIIEIWNQIKSKLIDVLNHKQDFKDKKSEEFISDLTDYIQHLKPEDLIGARFQVSNIFFLPKIHSRIIEEEIKKIIITPDKREKFFKMIIPYGDFYDKNWKSYMFIQQKLLDLEGNHIGFIQMLQNHTKYIRARKYSVDRLQKLKLLNKEMEKKIKERTRKLAESEKRYRILSEASNEVIIARDLNGTFTYVSPSIKKFSGYSLEEFMNLKPMETQTVKSFNTFISLSRKIYKLERQGKIELNRVHNLETQFKKKDGSIIDIEALGTYIRDESGKVTGILGVMRNISDRKLLERKLRESRERYKKAFESSNFFKDLLAHDMNNILNIISLSVELISMKKISSIEMEDLEECVDVIKRSVIRAERLVSTIRNLSKIEDSSISIYGLNALKLLNEAIKNIKKNFHNKKIHINVYSNNDESHVEANELLLDIFENILGNAIKYNKASIVEIEIILTDVKEGDKNFLKIQFIDNGIGVPDPSKKLIMQEGYLKKSNMRGLGIGLSLVKKAIESYQGRFWVEDKVKEDYTQGSNFVILIPKI